MHWQYTPCVLPLIIAAGVSATMALYAWQRRSTPGATAFVLLMLALTEWSLAYALELGSVDLPTKIFWSNAGYLGAVIAPAAWLVLVLQYSGHEKWLTPGKLAILAIEPLVTLLLVWTNGLHGLFQSNVRLDTTGLFPALVVTFETWFWVNAVYSYLLLLLGTLLLLRALVRSPYLYRGQAIALLIGALAPWVGNVSWVSGLNPFPGLNPTPFAFILTGLVMVWGLFRFRLLDIVPVARAAVVEGLSDGLIVLDAQDRIVDLNPVAERIVGCTTSEALGRPVAQALSGHSDLVERYRDVAEDGAEIVLGEDEAQRTYDLRVSPLHDRRDHLVGRLLVLRDITGRKRAEERLRTRERFLECLSEVSQQLLRASDLAEALPAVLRRLGGTAEVSRVYIFENRLGADGKLSCCQRYEWRAPGVEPQIDKPEQHSSPYVAGGFARWAQVLGRGDIIAGNVADFPESERAVLEPQSVRSVLVVPLFVSDAWYGFIGLDVCDQVREWQQVEVDLLRAAASDIASGIERDQARHRAQAMAEASAALTSTLDFEQVLDRILEQVSRVVPNDATNIMLVEGDHARIVRWRGYEHFGTEDFMSTVVFRVSELPDLQQMVDAGEPMVIPDTATHPTWVHRPQMAWLRSYAAAPITVRGELIGFLNVDSATPGFFTQAHTGLLRAFADQAAVAIENARLFDSLAREKKRLELLYRVARNLSESLRMEEVAGHSLRQTCAAVGAFKGILWSLEPSIGRLHLVAASGYEAESVEAFDQQVGLRVGRGLAGWVAAERRTAIVADVSRDQHWFAVDGLDEWVRSALVVPLLVRDRLVGVVSLYSESLDAFDEAQRQLVEAVVVPVSIAIENARLFQAEQQQTRSLALLADVARIVTTTLDADDLVQAVAESIHRHFGYAAVALFTLGEEGTMLVLRGYGGIPVRRTGTIVPGVYRQPVEVGIVGRVARTGRSHLAPDVSADPYYFPPDQLPIRSEVCVPILDHDRVVGVIDIESDRLADFDEKDQSLLEAVGDTVAIGLRNIRLYQEAQRRVRELTLLNRMSAGFGAALNVDAVINGALEGLHELVGADRTYFITTDANARTWEVAHELVAPGVEPSIGLSGDFDDMSVELGTILAGQPFAVFDVATDPRVEAMREMYRSLGMQSLLLVPVRTGRRLRGVLGFGYCRQKHALQLDEIRLLEGVAHQLELAIENVRLFEEAHLRAEELAAALAQQEELDRLKDQFIQNVSHELRTPLALIRGYAEMLDARELGELLPTQQKPMTVIARRARMLSDLVQDITLILEAETSPPGPEPVPLGELARTAVEDFQVAAEQAELTLHAEIAPQLPPVSGSYAYLRRVLDNLLGNAAKFTPRGGAIIVRVRQEGEQVALEVSDTGVGIPPDQLELIFERFYQVDGSARRRYGGVGLGLALVKEIVETYGGRVTVQSHVGEGSTFTVSFPIVADTDGRSKVSCQYLGAGAA